MNLYSVTFEKYNEKTGEFLGYDSVDVEAQHCSQAALLVETRATAVVDVSRKKGCVPTKQQFDEVVYDTGYARYFEHGAVIELDGVFTVDAVEMVLYAMNNHREWFKLDDQE